jgi:hypothetical protein
MSIQAPVRALERDLQGIFGARLRSFVAYGDAADDHGHDHGDAHAHDRALLHTLAIVDSLSLDDLRSCAGRAEDWHRSGAATPLLLESAEFERSLDAFPLELAAILDHHVVVSGENPFDRGTLDRDDVRRACEVQARSHLLHLREGFIETRGRADALALLIVQSAAPFVALLKTVARLQGIAAKRGDEGHLARQIERLLQLPGNTVEPVARLVHASEIPSADATRIFPVYLDAVERLVSFIDGWTSASSTSSTSGTGSAGTRA